MTNSTQILYDHLKDYPISTEGYHEIGNRSVGSVAAALCAEHMPDLPEASPEPRPRVRGGSEETTRQL